MFSPAELDLAADVEPDACLTPKFYRDAMSRCLPFVIGADAIALLPGWEKSRGVAVELALAKYLSLAVLCAVSGEPM